MRTNLTTQQTKVFSSEVGITVLKSVLYSQVGEALAPVQLGEVVGELPACDSSIRRGGWHGGVTVGGCAHGGLGGLKPGPPDLQRCKLEASFELRSDL